MSMKRILVVLVLALSATASLAAAPPAMQFNAPVKLAEGRLGNMGNRPVVSGTSIYAAFGVDRYENGTYGPESVRVVKSTNGGALWDRSVVMGVSSWSTYDYVDTNSARVAISNDPAVTGQKLVHAIWLGTGATTTLFYSYSRTADPAAGWSAPLAMPAPADDWYSEPTIIVTPANVIHVFVGGLGKVFHYTAPAAGQPFGPVEVLPVPAGTLNLGDPAVALDAAGTLHVAFVKDNEQLFYTKKTAAASSWTAPKVLFTAAEGMGTNISLALADASNVYVVFHEGNGDTTGNLRLAATTNGGTSWTVRVVAAGPTYARNNWSSVVATSGKIVTIAMEVPSADWSSQVVKVWRANAVDWTWAPVATLARGQETPALALDSSNKVHILVRDESHGVDIGIYGNLLWIKEK